MDLDGIRVLDLSQLLPGPYATQLLSDAGAEVLKIEPPRGDPARAFRDHDGWMGHVFRAVNNGKRSIVIDLKHPRGREAFYELVAGADVVFEQFRPGVVERLGVDYDTVRAHNPELVYCSLSGYGQVGPSCGRAGHDLNYAGVAGLVDLCREQPGEKPALPGYPVVDVASGAFAAASVVSALLSRALGNTDGEHVEVAMTDVALSLGSVEVAMADAGSDPRPGETLPTGQFPCYGVYEIADGSHVSFAALEEPFFRAFCAAVGRSELVDDHLSDDPAVRERLRDALEATFAALTPEEVDSLVSRDDVPVAPVNTPAEALGDEHVRGELLRESREGHQWLGAPAGTSGEAPTSLPGLGEHTDQVLEAAGFGPAAIEAMREAGAIQ